ncbi:MAG: response regulator receiver protein [Bryobacterales bacterium]|nr:response regulator receiver protein [Bryobacterales bacterium]
MGTNEKASVLIVDDEEMVITSVRAYLQLETDYEIHGFTEPEQAIKHMESNQVDIAVSDYLMPRISGIQFLGRAKQLQPEASRVLLTGHADKQSAIQAINEVGLYQYVEKPWENAQLLLIIQNGIERAQLLRELRQKVSELDTAHSSLKNVQKRLLQAFL